MIEFVPLTADHIMRLSEPIGPYVPSEITEELAEEIALMGGFAGVDGDEVLGVGGVMETWKGTGVAWLWMSRAWRKYANTVTEYVRDHIKNHPLKRIEVGVLTDFSAGHRWAKKLGLEMETPLARKWGPDGRDYSIYVRIK